VDAARTIEKAIETLFADTDVRTRDMGGKANTKDMTKAIMGLLK
jgi:isocitrate/isopropylmalate dehydrogenase